MTIRRVDKNCISCHITRQELDERGVNLDDLMSDREKARDLLRDVLTAAQDAVDFHIESGTLNVQMAVLADGDISITIFDDDKSAFAAMLRQYKELLESKRDELMRLAQHGRGNEGVLAVGGSLSALSPEETRILLTDAADDEPVDLPVEVGFDSIDSAIRVASMLYPWNGDAESSLRKYDDRYFLRVVLRETKRTLVRSIFALAEYCDDIERAVGGYGKVTEHGQVIIPEGAIKKLAQLAMTEQ